MIGWKKNPSYIKAFEENLERFSVCLYTVLNVNDSNTLRYEIDMNVRDADKRGDPHSNEDLTFLVSNKTCKRSASENLCCMYGRLERRRGGSYGGDYHIIGMTVR